MFSQSSLHRTSAVLTSCSCTNTYGINVRRKRYTISLPKPWSSRRSFSQRLYPVL